MKTKLNCILIIDDDEASNYLTRMILEEVDCAKHIKVAKSGREALNYLLKCTPYGQNNTEYLIPDLIFLDINMPVMDGWEFLEEYKKINALNKSIVVILTTSLFPDDKIKAAQMPEISSFENKSITTEKMNAVLKKYFSSTGSSKPDAIENEQYFLKQNNVK